MTQLSLLAWSFSFPSAQVTQDDLYEDRTFFSSEAWPGCHAVVCGSFAPNVGPVKVLLDIKFHHLHGPITLTHSQMRCRSNFICSKQCRPSRKIEFPKHCPASNLTHGHTILCTTPIDDPKKYFAVKVETNPIVWFVENTPQKMSLLPDLSGLPYYCFTF